MAAVDEEESPPDPVFITNLFSLKSYRCIFVVGNTDLTKTEKIGVVPEMLMAHSEVLQCDMLQREIEEKKRVDVEDMYPDTFRNLLRYCYGYDNTGSLCFDEADNLIYAAHKYMIKPLMDRVAARLITLLNPNNICSLLNNPVCCSILELDVAITQILQSETRIVFSSPSFLELTSDALVKVLEQEAMNATEIEVWRAAVKWAKHRSNSENGQDLRKALEGPAKHIRVCAIDDQSFFEEVYQAGILTDKEMNEVTFSKFMKEKSDALIEFSNEIKNRRLLTNKLNFNFKLQRHSKPVSHTSNELYILTKKQAIELSPLWFQAIKWKHDSLVPEGLSYRCQVTLTITRITDYRYNTSSEPPETIELCQQVEYGKQFTVPVAKGGKNIVLLSNNKYHLAMKFSSIITMYYSDDSKPYENEHFYVMLFKDKAGDYYKVPCKTLSYRPLQTSTKDLFNLFNQCD